MIPVEDLIEVLFTVDQPGSTELRIINTMGAVMMAQQVDLSIGNNRINLNALQLENGIYLVQLETGNNLETLKFIKQ